MLWKIWRREKAVWGWTVLVREAWEGSVKVSLGRDLYMRKQPDIQSSSANLFLCPTSASHPHIWYVLDLIIIVKWVSLSRVQLFATPWTIQSMEFSSPEYWNRQPFPSPGDLPNPGINPRSPTLQVDSLPAEPQGKPIIIVSADFWCF